MVRRWVLIGGMVLGLSALLLTPGPSEAWHRGGYFYGSPYWAGGYWGGYHGYGPGYYGGYGSYGFYPGYAYGYSYAPGYVYSAPMVNYSVGVPTTNYQSFYPSEEGASAGRDNSRVRLDVTVPGDAEVWVEGQKTTQRGTRREFVSPPLNGEGRFVYTVRARWDDNGRPVDRTEKVRVRPGETATVDFRSARGNDRRDVGGAGGRDDYGDRFRDEDRRDRDRFRDDDRRDRNGAGAIGGTGTRRDTGNTGTGARPGTSGTGTNTGTGARTGESTTGPGTTSGTGARTGGTSGSPQSGTPGGANPGATGGATPGGAGSSGSGGGSSR